MYNHSSNRVEIYCKESINVTFDNLYCLPVSERTKEHTAHQITPVVERLRELDILGVGAYQIHLRRTVSGEKCGVSRYVFLKAVRQ